MAMVNGGGEELATEWRRRMKSGEWTTTINPLLGEQESIENILISLFWD
jgi:hypothetical protein